MKSAPMIQNEIKFLKKYFKPGESRMQLLGQIIAICIAILSLIVIAYIMIEFGKIAYVFTTHKGMASDDGDEVDSAVDEFLGWLSTLNKSITIEPPLISTSKPTTTPRYQSTSTAKTKITTPASKATTELTSTSVYEPPYLVNTKGCQIPDLNPFDPTTWLLYRVAHPIVCEVGAPLPLIESNNTSIFVNQKARRFYYNDTDDIDCCWRTFWRSLIRDNHVLYSKTCTPFNESAFISQEFVKVECRLKNNTMYEDFFPFVQTKASVLKRILALDLPISYAEHRKLNVLIIGMNSVSRLNLHRSMPRTVRTLQKMGAIELLGYNKVGYNMYDNVVPLISGLSPTKFEKFCLPNPNKPFDKCPFLWKDFAIEGYRTILAEDNCNTSIYNHFKPGFRLQPTDYYLRPLCVAAEPKIGNAEICNTYMCQGARRTFDRLLDYTLAVADKFVDRPYFGLFWQSSLTYDFSQNAQLGDGAYNNLITTLRKKDLLRNTALIFMSDHGERWGTFRQSYQGRLEENLPFVFMYLPDWWKAEHPTAWKSLYKNARRLTTPYDIHETLRDILDPKRLNPEATGEEFLTHTKNYVGKSLFKPISEERTCEKAGIPGHWCTCHHRHEVSKNDGKIYRMAQAIVRKINKMIVKEPLCARQNLSSVIDVKITNDANYARKLILEEWNELSNSEEKMEWSEFSLTIKTTPGNGIFEGLVKYYPDNTVKVVGPVSRFNSYAENSVCVNDFSNRFYCYCSRKA